MKDTAFFLLKFRNKYEDLLKRHFCYNDLYYDNRCSVGKNLFEYEHRNDLVIKVFLEIHTTIIKTLNDSHSRFWDFCDEMQKFQNKRYQKYLLKILNCIKETQYKNKKNRKKRKKAYTFLKNYLNN